MSYKQNQEREEKLSREKCPVCGGPVEIMNVCDHGDVITKSVACKDMDCNAAFEIDFGIADIRRVN
jgi:hypothetical protein